ncbi:unnamed protein product [Chrysoparadoxa australica]
MTDRLGHERPGVAPGMTRVMSYTPTTNVGAGGYLQPQGSHHGCQLQPPGMGPQGKMPQHQRASSGLTAQQIQHHRCLPHVQAPVPNYAAEHGALLPGGVARIVDRAHLQRMHQWHLMNQKQRGGGESRQEEAARVRAAEGHQAQLAAKRAQRAQKQQMRVTALSRAHLQKAYGVQHKAAAAVHAQAPPQLAAHEPHALTLRKRGHVPLPPGVTFPPSFQDSKSMELAQQGVSPGYAHPMHMHAERESLGEEGDTSVSCGSSSSRASKRQKLEFPPDQEHVDATTLLLMRKPQKQQTEAPSKHEGTKDENKQVWDKLTQKRIANRKSAQMSRKRKKAFLEDLKTENAALKRHEEILEVVPDPVFAFKAADGLLWFVSNSAAIQFGLSLNDLDKTSFFDLMTPDCSKRLQEFIAKEEAKSQANTSESPPSAAMTPWMKENGQRMTVRFLKTGKDERPLVGELCGRVTVQENQTTYICSVRILSLQGDEIAGYVGDNSTSEFSGEMSVEDPDEDQDEGSTNSASGTTSHSGECTSSEDNSKRSSVQHANTMTGARKQLPSFARPSEEKPTASGDAESISSGGHDGMPIKHNPFL